MNKSAKPAFPVTAGHEVYSNGISLRDYFAAQSLAGLVMDGRYGGYSPTSIAKACYDIADAMIAESEKPNVTLCPDTLEAAAKAVIGLQHGEEVGLDNELECENNGYQIAAQTIRNLKGEA